MSLDPFPTEKSVRKRTRAGIPWNTFCTHTEWALALLLTAVVTGLILYQSVQAGGLWRDECGVVQMARMASISEMADYFTLESFPLAYHLLMRLYTGFFGTSDTVMRIYGLCVGLMMVAALWWSARKNGGTLPLLSLAILGVNPAFIVWGTTVRGYGLGCVGIVMTCALFARMLHAPSRAILVGAFAASLLAIHCLLYNVALLPVLGLSAALILARPRQSATSWSWQIVGILGFCALSLLPYVSSYQRGTAWAAIVKQTPSLEWLWGDFVRAVGLPSPWVAAAWLGLALITLVGLVIHQSGTTARDRTPLCNVSWYAILAAPASLGCFFVFLLILGYGPRPWYYLALVSLLAVMTDLAHTGLRNVLWFRILRIVMVLSALMALPIATLPALGQRQTNMDLVVQKLNREVVSGDYILVNPWYYGVSFNWYYRGQAPWSTLPVLGDHRIHRYDLLQAAIKSPNPNKTAMESMMNTLQSGHRVWVVGGIPLLQQGQQPVWLAPSSSTFPGWSEGEYSYAWGTQAAHLLQNTATQGNSISVPLKQKVNVFETVDLLMFQGWKKP